MSFRSIATGLITIAVSSAFLYVGCGGGDSSPTRPAQPTTPTPTPTPTPPPAPTVSVVEVSPNAATLEVAKTQRFTATAKASDGTVISGVNFTWSSSNTAVVTINNNGVATAVAAGTATVRATGNSISSAPVTINVTEPPPPEPVEPVVATVTVSPPEAMIEEGATQQFAAMASTSDGMEIPDAEITWSSSDEMVATVDSDGLATGVGSGEAMITATADSVSGIATLTVAEPPPPAPMVSTVTVSPTAMTIVVGGMFQFTAVATTAEGMVVEDVDFTWMSDDTDVATVDETGLVTAIGSGTAMITATGNGVTSMPATVTVEESAPAIATVSIMDAMPVMLEIGDTHQLMAVARTSEGIMIGGVTFAWSSDDNEVATVDSTGLITAVAPGMADITAMADEITSDPVSVTVAEPPPDVDRVSVEPMTASIGVGEMQQFTATAYDADNMEIVGKTYTWETNSTTVATIDAMGLATGVGGGSTTITATVDDVSGTARLTVNDPPDPPDPPPPPPPPPPPVVDRVAVSPSSPSIEEGETQQFSATAYESDNTEITGKTFTWTSSNTTVATINTSGLATAQDAGSTTITASVDGKSGTASLTVTEPPPPPPVVDRVAVSPSSPSIEEGETQQFSATAYEADNTQITGKTFTWSSSNTTVATISTSGLATAQDAGSTTISAEVDGKSGSASLTVTEPTPPPMLRSRTGTISGRNNYSSGGSVTLSEVAGGKLKLEITGLSTPGGAPDVFVALYTSNDINWPNSGSLPDGARGFGEVSRQSGNKSWTFTPASGEDIDSWSHLILHCRLINSEVGSASLSN